MKHLQNLGKILSKQEQQSIKGGYVADVCEITFVYNDGRPTYSNNFFTHADDSSSWANDQCVNALSQDSGMSRCFYDCAHDGEG